MRASALALCTLLLAARAPAQDAAPAPAPPPAPARVAVRAALLIDGTGAALIRNPVVLIEGDGKLKAKHRNALYLDFCRFRWVAGIAIPSIPCPRTTWRVAHMNRRFMLSELPEVYEFSDCEVHG